MFLNSNLLTIKIVVKTKTLKRLQTLSVIIPYNFHPVSDTLALVLKTVGNLIHNLQLIPSRDWSKSNYFVT